MGFIHNSLPFGGPDRTEDAIDRFKPFYAKLYPTAPSIPDNSFLESRFLHHLIRTQVKSDFSPLLAGAIKDRLRVYGAPYYQHTGHSICSLRMPDLDAFPLLEETLKTARLSLTLLDEFYPLYGVMLVDQEPSINLAAEIEIYVYARINLGRGEPFELTNPPDGDVLSKDKIATIQAAARRADVDAVLDMVGECWKR